MRVPNTDQERVSKLGGRPGTFGSPGTSGSPGLWLRTTRTVALWTVALGTVALGTVALTVSVTGVAFAQETPRAGDEISAKFRAQFEAIQRPTITAEINPPPKTLVVGRAVIQPGPSTRLFVFSAGGRNVGYLLDGEAELVYTVEDRLSMPPARDNLKRAKGFDLHQTDDKLVASTTLKGAAVWGWDLELGDGAAEPVTGHGLPAWLLEILDEKYSSNPARDLLISGQQGDADYRMAILQSRGEDLFLDVDPRPLSRSESLSRLEKVRRKGAGPLAVRQFEQLLATQPIDRSWQERAAVEFLSTNTEIDLVNKKGDHVRVKTRTRLLSQRDGLRFLSMRHLEGVLDTDGHWREYRLLKLTVDGQPAPFVQKDSELLVALPRTAKRGDAFLLEVEAEGEILIRPAGDNYWRLGGTPWYPKPGAGGREWAEFHMTAEVPSPFVVFAAGEILEQETRGGVSKIRTHLKGPMETAMAGKYRTITQQQDGTRIHISGYGSIKKKSAERLGQVLFSVMDCLGVWLGVPYPFQDLQVVELNQWGWGQAPPGFIFITQEAFLTKASAELGDNTRSLAALFSKGINERVAHEVAHAWFPHVAKNVRGQGDWLSESLADYASAVCLQQRTADKRRGQELFDRQLMEWKHASKDAGDATSVYLASYLAGSDDSPRIRQNLLYGRGPLVLHAIRRHLNKKHGEQEGDRLFLTWIRSYIKNFTFKLAETRYMVNILEQVTGEPWQPFFDRYVYGPESPQIDD